MGSNGNVQILVDQSQNGTPSSQMLQKSIPAAVDQATSVTYTRQVPFPENSTHIEQDPKSAAAAMAAKLTASSSSAQMLTYVLSSLASEGVVMGNSIEEPAEKKAKLENEIPSYVPQNSDGPPPPPSSPPPLPPLPPPLQSYPVPQYMQTAMPFLSGSYTYSPTLQPPLAPPGYTPAGAPAAGVSTSAPPTNAYQNFPPEGGFYGQQSSLPMAPMSRQ